MLLLCHHIRLWGDVSDRFAFCAKFGLVGVLTGLLVACSSPTTSDPKMCTATFEPVCGVVPPVFCQLADCGRVEKTFDNVCMANQAGAEVVAQAPCGMTPGAFVARANFPTQSRIFRREDAISNPYDPSQLAELYAYLEGPLKIESTTVELTRSGVELLVVGLLPQQCGDVSVRQMARLGDSFGIAVTHGGQENCTGPMTEFSERLFLQPGRNGWMQNMEYEVVVNGRIGRFVL